MPTVLLAIAVTRAILAKTGGEPAVPLDDAFIHFEFARSLARFDPLAYGAHGQHVAGATSLLWPLVLAPFQWLGLSGNNIIWPAWFLGWASLGLLARETLLVAEGLLSKQAGAAAAAMVFAFGGYVWFAASGMEVVPFAWLLMRGARLSARWGEQTKHSATFHESARFAAYGWLLPLMRPEGALLSSWVMLTLLLFPRGRSRAWCLLAASGPAVPALLNRLFGGQWATTTAEVKWLLLSPYRPHIWPTIRYYLELFWTTLLDGRAWSAAFVPQGSRLVAWAALPALVIAGWRRRRHWRAASVLVVALGILLTTTFDSFLVNRLRYLWPFAAAWFVGLGALADEVGATLGRYYTPFEGARAAIAGGFVGALASHWSYAIEDLAVSADAIRSQQVELGRWARTHLPSGSSIGLNDAGAITYFSGLPTFDVVGLTTPGEGRYWVSGPGSRFEHYERLGRERMPTHFIVYPRWMAIPALLGVPLTARSVEGATILGDTTKVVYEARYDALGSAELPLLPENQGVILDALDVADLESERAHNYELELATQAENLAMEDDSGRVDGGRTNRAQDSFWLNIAPPAKLILRVAAEFPIELEVWGHDRRLGTVQLAGLRAWEERALRLPAGFPAGSHQLLVRAAAGAHFTSLHYWCVR